jgi:hypothetical protein
MGNMVSFMLLSTRRMGASMLRVTYKITVGPDQTFKVAVSGRGVLCGASGFKNKADAEAWVNWKKRQAEGAQNEAPQMDTEDGPITA